MRRNLAVLFLVLAVLPAAAQYLERVHVPLPAELAGVLSDGETPYVIRVPENWNGKLLLFLHGTQIGPLHAEIAPTPWPVPSVPFEEQLFETGYALAGCGYRNDPKSAQLSNFELALLFRTHVGLPLRTIAWGNSLGGLATLRLIENYPGIFDAAIANCPTCAGQAENQDQALAFGLAYAVAFGWNDGVWGPIEDLRDDLNFFTDVRPLVPWPSPSGPLDGRWEFIRLVNRMPPQAFWQSDPQSGTPFFGLQMWKATQQRAAREAESGGVVADNVGFEYSLSSSEKAYLATLGVDAEAFLAAMNARTNIQADPRARFYAEKWGGLSGKLVRPVITMHSIYDGLSIVANESAYLQNTQRAHFSEHLVQAYVTGVGHCSFDAEQYLAALDAMQTWLEKGTRPDESLLPASKGFDLGYVPPDWPF